LRKDLQILEELASGPRGIQEFRDAITELEEYTRQNVDDTSDGKELTKHHFAPGAYVREFFLPKGMYFTSKIHKTTHIFLVAHGKTMIVSENGRQVVEGPQVFVTKPGTKRAVYGIEDTTFFTFHVTEETDPVLIEKTITAESFAELEHDEIMRIEE
jgi:quercetin dioxygenase-like cupin family protein